ncbi:hypothetical protein EDI_222320 [Entamoeba dispar SAW760]|uniref:Uncharacterized protein n=1 Tax=Entamoeba dispar (strain ATCC PRA-260 / SAW760) TaxID=370354 RepID=B0EKZ6_ENTDS|nr:uncharacterized protein EDI_222320 [Entamoeba dispar SAW760]EDR24816.1 hypothetical protein EDI_222320 [Entamoeba dispar SAW760]|eukprot:EDR24816.1 hypothetical protein EDI_222320 [Entamoeba dispar SAW760]
MKRSIFNTPLTLFKKTKLELIKSNYIIYFIEGTTENGTIILKPQLLPIQNIKPLTLSGLKYISSFNTFYSQATPFIKYIFGILSQIHCKVNLTLETCTEINEEVISHFFRNNLKVTISSFNSYDKSEFVRLASK